MVCTCIIVAQHPKFAVVFPLDEVVHTVRGWLRTVAVFSLDITIVVNVKSVTKFGNWPKTELVIAMDEV